MPHLMIVADAHECLFVKWSGALSLEGRRGYAKALEALTPAEAAYRRFHDVRDAVLDVPTEDVAAAARHPVKAGEAPAVRVSSAILVSSELGYGMMLVGAIFSASGLITVGAILFAAVLAFQVVTLPVEYDASARAKKLAVASGIVTAEERLGVDKVLNAAALTYVAAAISTLMTMLYFLARRN